MKIDQSNKRIRRVLDATLLELGKIHDEHIDKAYSIDDVKLINEVLVDMDKDLNKIDNNITHVKMEITAEVKLTKMLEEKGATLDTISSNLIGNNLDRLLTNIVETEKHEEKFFDIVLESLFLLAALCDIYLRNNSTVEHNVDFKEVEDRYE